MWTEITRPKYERRGGRYASDLTDREWALIAPFMPPRKKIGRPRTTELRNVMDAIMYMASTGCQWAMLPNDFPPPSTVQRYFYDWRSNGVLEAINHHDYKRNGTTTLFAALNVLDGTVIGRCMQRHRHQEFLRFLKAVEREAPVGKMVHVILDNYAAHKHPKVRAWLARHPRFVFHFVPTSCSWLNAVEGYFAKLSRRRLKRGVFRSVVDLQTAINRFIDETNDDPKPFVWTADPDKIIAAVKRGHQMLDSIH